MTSNLRRAQPYQGTWRAPVLIMGGNSGSMQLLSGSPRDFTFRDPYTGATISTCNIHLQQSDANLVVRKDDEVYWASGGNLSEEGNSYLQVQGDGNLVINSGIPIQPAYLDASLWATDTEGSVGRVLWIEDNCDLVLDQGFDPDYSTEVWRSGPL